jgi:hypothetical protein
MKGSIVQYRGQVGHFTSDIHTLRSRDDLISNSKGLSSLFKQGLDTNIQMCAYISKDHTNIQNRFYL